MVADEIIPQNGLLTIIALCIIFGVRVRYCVPQWGDTYKKRRFVPKIII